MGGGPGRVAERAQLILVGALTLAVVLVAIALVLNSAIYAENLATRANQNEPTRLSTLQEETAASAAGATSYHNHHNASHSNYSELRSRLDGSIRNWSTLQVRDSAREGRFMDIDVTSMDNGTRIVQDDGGEFVPEDSGLLQDIIDITDVSSWAVTPTAYQARDFTMTVERDEISDATLYAEANVETFLAELGGSVSVGAEPFTMMYDLNDDGTYEHRVAVYRPDDGDTDSNDVKFTHYNAATGNTTCEVDNASATFDVDVSGGVVEGGGGACEAVFDFQSASNDPYQLVFVQGEEIEGDYELVVETNKSDFAYDYEGTGGLLDTFGLLGTYDFESYYHRHNDDHGSSSSHSSPYVEPAIYDATVTIDYRSNTLNSTSSMRVAPNEP